MIIDKSIEFSTEQAMATGVSDNTLDVKVGGDAMTNELMLVVRTVEKAAGGTSFTVELQTSDTEDFATTKVLYNSGAVPLSDITKDGIICAVRMPRGCKRYLRLNYTADGTFTTGKVWAALVNGDQYGWETQD